MDWEKLKTFYHVAHLGSFTKAAEHLNISQSALSRQVLILEKRLGIDLLERLPRGVILTRKGEILFKTVEDIVRKIRTTENLLKDAFQEPSGSLRITGAGTWMTIIFLDYLREFCDLYPQIYLDITTTETRPNFHYNTTDVAILPFIPHTSRLIQKYLMTFHMGLYASPDYLQRYGEPHTVEDLDHHRLLNYGDEENTFNNLSWHLSIGCPPGHVRKPFMRIKSGTRLRQAAEQGIGIASLSQENYKINQSNLVRVLPHLESPPIKVFLIYPQEIKNFKSINALENFIFKVIERNNWK